MSIFTQLRLMKLPNVKSRDSIAYAKMLSPLIMIVFVGVYFHTFIINAVMANPAINGLIMTTAIYGVALIMARLIAAQEDFYIIERFGAEALAGAEMTELLEQPWIRHRYVRHYLKHIAHTEGTLSSELDQNAIESELHALSNEYNSKLELPQFLVGFMIALGLLGTFIGLLETLTGISGMLSGLGKGDSNAEEQFMALVGELRKPLAGMGIAFSASMFGLVTSLMLAVMMINLRRYISRVLMCARNVMHDLTKISREHQHRTADGDVLVPIHGAGGQGGGGQGGGGRGRQQTEDEDVLGGSNILIANRMDVLLRKLEILFKSFESSIAGTTRLNDLLGFGPRMKETGERTLEELRVIAGATTEQQRIAQQTVDANSMMVTSLTNILDTQRRAQGEFANAMKVFVERLSKLEESHISIGRHLYEIKENLVKSSGSYDMIEPIMSGIGHQTLLLEALVKEARNSQKSLAAIENVTSTPPPRA